MTFQIRILGCGSATPTLYRNPSAQLIEVDNHFLLIDCGEGTQLQLRKYKYNIQRIDDIFISHLHGDHYLGLLGLISSMSLLGRQKQLNLYGPAGLEKLVMINIKLSKTYLNFHINFKTTQIKKRELILETDNFTVTSFPVKHRVDCTGFVIRQKEKQRNIIKPLVEKYNLGIAEMVMLKKGQNVIRENGERILFTEVTCSAEKPKSYAYCTDTKYYRKIIDEVKNVDLLYHEATFLHALKDRAKDTFHSTAIQAATIAKDATVKKLILGHYSSRYTDVVPLEIEAKTIFSNTTAIDDGMLIEV